MSQLPEAIGQLSNLQYLYLSFTLLSQLPEAIGQLSNLQSLDLNFTQLSQLPEAIGQLSNLQYLYLSSTQLSQLPEAIGQLSNLQHLHLNKAQLNQLPAWWRNWKYPPKEVDLRGNPLPIPAALLGPTEVRDKPGDFATILNFYFQAQNSEAKPLDEAKLLIVGEGEAGKTTLAQKLQDQDYQLRLPSSNSPEPSTEGIDIIEWQFDQPSSAPFHVNVWDFGGQEIYHATHQFFLTNRSLYAFVIDNRRENPNFYYWLNIVRLLSDNSPIFIVENEKQDRRCEINSGQLRAEFDNLINQTVRVNFADNRGLDDLKALIKKHITTLPEIQDPWPHKWLRVRYSLENDRANYITQAEYFDRCRNNGVPNKTEALQVSSLLHSLGICLHFQKDPALKHYVILNPTWATNAVYKVTDNKQVQADLGRFTRENLTDIWSDGKYAEMQDELLQLMQKFAICYPLRDRPNTFIAPSLLSVDRPDYTWDNEQNLILRYEYEFMPKGMLTRLIVEMHEFIEPDPSVQGLVWKTGVVLNSGNARAQVVENYDKRDISIQVSGTQRRTLLDWIRREFQKIHATYPNLNYQELIPCNCEKCDGQQKPHTYPLDVLLQFQRDHQSKIQCPRSYEMVNVQHLINDVIIESSRQAPAAVEAETRLLNKDNDIAKGRDSRSRVSHSDAHTSKTTKTILFLASNPEETGRLRLDQELREIGESLCRAPSSALFDLKNKGAVRSRDFYRSLLETKPQIVHFSGHGKDNTAPNDNSRTDTRKTSHTPESAESEPQPIQGLLFEDETGHPKLVSSEQLADVFELFADQIECVLLNACHSQNQANAIAQHIPYVIGMSRPISDKGAIEFAIAFYDAIGAGRDIPFAFKLARTQLTPFGEKDIPQLIQKTTPSRSPNS